MSTINKVYSEIASYGGRDNYGRDPRDPTKQYNMRFSIYNTLKKRLNNQIKGSPGIQPFSKRQTNSNSVENTPLGIRTKDR